MLHKLIFFITLIVSNLILGTVHSEESLPLQSTSGKVCWPLNFAGITLGITNDSQVRRLLGNGVFRSGEGDTGGRYFIDKKKSATLHAVMYTDAVVGELAITEGVESSLKKTELDKAVSHFFLPDSGFGNWHSLHLGASKIEVIKNLGNPARRNNEDSWEYTTSCTCEIPQFFTVNFKSDRLFQIVFSAPAG